MADFEDLVDEWADDVDEEADYALNIMSKAYVSGSDWTVGTLLDQFRQGNLDITPAFQRRGVWDDRRSSRFIESLFLGLPIPQLVLAEDKSRVGGYIVLDGKQRLLTLAAFASGSSFLAGSNLSVPPLKLRGLEFLKELNNRSLSDLQATGEAADRVRQFQNRTVRTVVINGWEDEDYLNLVFRRLNSGSVPLSTQELRQALHSGPFTNYLNEYTTRSVPLQRALGLHGPDFRMRDVELALRFVSLDQRINRYSGNLKQFLDDAVVDLNSDWASEQDHIVESLDGLDTSIYLNELIFGDRAVFRRFVSGRYERRFNRAVFDVQALAMSRPPLARIASSRPEVVKEAFERLSESDPVFSESLTSTTKSITATFERLSRWIGELNRVLGSDYPEPRMIDNRIHWSN